jgi:hypothetical protein
MNPNNETITVDVTLSGAIGPFITLETDSLVLEANETKKLNFDIRLENEGEFVGELLFLFTPIDGQGVALSSQIVVIAEKGETIGANGEDNLLLYAFALVIIVAILLYLWGRRK